MLNRLTAPLALSLALALPATAMDLGKLTDEERALFRAEVRAYLLEHPQVIMEAVDQLQRREAEAQAQADVMLVTNNAAEIFDDGYSFVGGNPEGDITLVEFLDYRCGYCKRAFGEVETLLETDGNIRLIVKEFPILGEESVLASRFAVATKQVAGGEAYKALHDALMTFNGTVSLTSLRRLAEGLEIDADAVEARMGSEEVTEEITRTRALAEKLGISGTPTFVMQDELLRGYVPLDQMRALVEDKRG